MGNFLVTVIGAFYPETRRQFLEKLQKLDIFVVNSKDVELVIDPAMGSDVIVICVDDARDKGTLRDIIYGIVLRKPKIDKPIIAIFPYKDSKFGLDKAAYDDMEKVLKSRGFKILPGFDEAIQFIVDAKRQKEKR